MQAMKNTGKLFQAVSLVFAIASFPAVAAAADVILSGAVKSAAGEKLGGVMISAKGEGKTITTSIFTDGDGNYFFPPMPAGKYQVWAQALTFETAKSSVDLGAAKKQDFQLKPMADFAMQLP